MNAKVGDFIEFNWTQARLQPVSFPSTKKGIKKGQLNVGNGGPVKTINTYTTATTSTWSTTSLNWVVAPSGYIPSPSIAGIRQISGIVRRKVKEVTAGGYVVKINRGKVVIHSAQVLRVVEPTKSFHVEIACSNADIPIGKIKITPEIKSLLDTIVSLSNQQVYFRYLKCKKN